MSTNLASTAQPVDAVMPPNTNGGEDGCLLLSVEGNLIFAINGTGLVIWEMLEVQPVGMTLGEVVDQLELVYTDCAVPRGRLENDARRLLTQLTEKGLVFWRRNASEPIRYKVRDDVFRTGGICDTSDELNAEYDRSMSYRPRDLVETDRLRSFRDTLLGLVGLLTYDVLHRFSGFGQICRLVEEKTVARERSATPHRVRQVVAGVDRARLWYPKDVLCLQHSAVIAYLSRRQGAYAHMKIAGRQVPFYAHAWVEIGTTVVNDEQAVRDRYSVFRRCLSPPDDAPELQVPPF